MTLSAQTPVDAATVLGRLSTLLALGGQHAMPAALQVLVDGMGLRSVVLRRVPPRGYGEVLAVAGDALCGLPPLGSSRPAALEVPVPGGHEQPVSLIVVGAGPVLLPALRAAAAVIGLSLCLEPAAGLVEELLDRAEDDRDLLADLLHDGPLQDLVVARYAADATLPAGDNAVRDAIQVALVGLRRALWHLRPRGAHGLCAALTALSGRLVEAGLPPLVLTVHDGGDDLRHATAMVAYRIVQAKALLATGGCEPVSVTLHGGPRSVRLVVAGGTGLREAESWRLRARALGGELTVEPDCLRLTLPTDCDEPAPASSDLCFPNPKAAL